MSEERLSQEEILYLLKRAVMDAVIYCGFCDYEPLEADYDFCPSCHKYNPLKKEGLI